MESNQIIRRLNPPMGAKMLIISARMPIRPMMADSRRFRFRRMCDIVVVRRLAYDLDRPRRFSSRFAEAVSAIWRR